jgi:hypothetical protein
MYLIFKIKNCLKKILPFYCMLQPFLRRKLSHVDAFLIKFFIQRWSRDQVPGPALHTSSTIPGIKANLLNGDRIKVLRPIPGITANLLNDGRIKVLRPIPGIKANLL